ncbi:hypothetical protein [Streptomyces sp. NPDC050534]|uniref:hypothetical protein n=1 Tax=Streptomyces sp. NPDC050534 TaxID=3365625 RepID=UPI0037AAB99E
MTEAERAVDDAERARDQGGGLRRLVPLPGRLVRDELGVLLVLALLITGIGIAYPDFLSPRAGSTSRAAGRRARCGTRSARASPSYRATANATA